MEAGFSNGSTDCARSSSRALGHWGKEDEGIEGLREGVRVGGEERRRGRT